MIVTQVTVTNKGTNPGDGWRNSPGCRVGKALELSARRRSCCHAEYSCPALALTQRSCSLRLSAFRKEEGNTGAAATAPAMGHVMDPVSPGAPAHHPPALVL